MYVEHSPSTKEWLLTLDSASPAGVARESVSI